MHDTSIIQAIINEYRKSQIQSEAEVRSKFVVPLLEALGYPSELRAEEFLVYGYGGREPLNAKDADFILFTESDFGKHRNNTQKSKKWVQEHSLLIIEAKKPGKMPADLGQAQFYTMWTKAVAYIETDGEYFKGYYLNPISSDMEIIDVEVDKLAKRSELQNFSYKNILTLKEHGMQPSSILDASYEIITDDSDLNLPATTIDYMRDCLGKNSNGLTNVQIVSRFLNTTESMLHNDMRYDIPPYMINFPRHQYVAKLYIDNMIFPYMTGQIIEFYRDDEVRYLFESDYIEIIVVYNDGILSDFEIGYRVLDKYVSERIEHFDYVKKCLDSDNVRINIEDNIGIQLLLPTKNPGTMWSRKQHVNEMFDFWLDGLKKLKSIEEYYEIEFKLQYISEPDDLNHLYDAIDIVYAGIMMQQNCVITIPGNLSEGDIEILEPQLFEDTKEIPLPCQIIHNIIFKPYRSAMLPCKAIFSGKGQDDIVKIPACCEYKIIEAKG